MHQPLPHTHDTKPNTSSPTARALVVFAGLSVGVLPAGEAWAGIGALKAVAAHSRPQEQQPPVQMPDAPPPPSPTAEAPPAPTGAGHLVNKVLVVYARPHPNQPTMDRLLLASMDLVSTDDGLAPAAPRQPGTHVTMADLERMDSPRFSDRGLAAFAPAMVERLKQLGLVGVYVTPDPREFVVADGKVVDKRPAGSGELTLVITTGEVKEVRTQALGDRVPADKTLNNPIHAWIRARSPVQAGAESQAVRKDLLRGDKINDYVARLSRYDWRRVDSSIAATGTEPGAATLDYLITENKPWLLFAQLSNTGTASTSRLREHFGFVHNDLTNNDDVFRVGWHTANFSAAHTLYASYEAPIADLERWRWRIFGSWYTYRGSDVGLDLANFKGEGWNAGAEAIWNVHQYQDLFLDLVGGAQFKHVRVDDRTAAIAGHDNFFIPHVKARLERHRDTSRIDAELGLEFNIPGAAGTNDNLDALGRVGADNSWVVLKGAATTSFYIEPLVAPQGGAPAGLANEIALSVSGQHAFGNRLIPNETMVEGGLYTVRGYPESITAGDTAVVASAEYRLHLVPLLDPDQNPGELFGKPFRWRPQYRFGPADWDLQLKAFIDAGRVVNSDRRSFEVDQTLLGTGVGAELSFSRNFRIRVDWGFALEGLDDSSGNRITDAGHNELSFLFTVVY